MFSLLLALIYVSFISLGLPDSLLGSAWPQMQESLGVSLSLGGVISFLITASTILSSLMSHQVIQRFGTGAVTMCSVAMTALALFGFSLSNSFFALCLWAIPYGLGAGSVDAALNNFVALHCKAKHMSWLHCFWGIGATGGPYIMGLCLSRGMGWQAGYRTISFLQMALTLILLLSLPLWKKQELPLSGGETVRPQTPQWGKLMKRPGVKAALTAFFFYSALELTTGLWGSSYMVAVRGISPETAAKWISLFYLGITAGRFFSGFLTLRFSDDAMVRLGEITAIVGILLILLPLHNLFLCLGLILTGLGCAPIYPSLLHATPQRFGKSLSQSLMGTQMAISYLGSTTMPPVSGFLSEKISMGLYPVLLLVFALMLTILTEKGRHCTAE
ncbi:MFS transporter [Anaerotignum lactatifermentans]|uniref:Fucose permease n=1 Tax=Anaerotignum lactatifermentans DSM 14214 TaxID=1121323 RepID=A0A1M6XQN4_9FIRM|nr:MFS transporter [Anaerotignum lactatifermentans]SHL08307.1 Fucose permease [[Clostridium] lactatifermentans DSM 14214] [Anaerotignum lactatifermentans DSM 14214]